MPEEKEQINELSLEQMKELISVAALLPHLITKINLIDTTLQRLSETQEKLTKGVIDILKQYEGYKNSVEELTSKVVIKNDLDDLKKEIENLKSLLNNLEVNEKKTEETEKPKAKSRSRKKAESDDEKVNRLVESIIKNQKSGWTTDVDKLMKSHGCERHIAERVLKILEEKGYYNPKNKKYIVINN